MYVETRESHTASITRSHPDSDSMASVGVMRASLCAISSPDNAPFGLSFSSNGSRQLLVAPDLRQAAISSAA